MVILVSMVISETAPLVLGSQSPRRREILLSLRLPFVTRAGPVDESQQSGDEPAGYLERVVKNKLVAASSRCAGEVVAGLLVADTIVVVGSEILGKPKDMREACALLDKIVGRTHTVWTRYALSCSPALHEIVVARSVRSEVTLRAASAEEVRRYAESGEGLDKAGAYAVQGLGAFLIEAIHGSHTNVIGLPVCELVQDLQRCGLLGLFP